MKANLVAGAISLLALGTSFAGGWQSARKWAPLTSEQKIASFKEGLKAVVPAASSYCLQMDTAQEHQDNPAIIGDCVAHLLWSFATDEQK